MRPDLVLRRNIVVIDLIHRRVFLLQRDEIRIADAVTISGDADEPESAAMQTNPRRRISHPGVSSVDSTAMLPGSARIM